MPESGVCAAQGTMHAWKASKVTTRVHAFTTRSFIVRVTQSFRLATNGGFGLSRGLREDHRSRSDRKIMEFLLSRVFAI
jgi:hypothetical protein